MRKACFIIPYFGKFSDTFAIFLRTCDENPDFDWLIITDDQRQWPYPPNVHVQYTSFGDFSARVQSNFDFPISLYRAYKICDFRATFGVIFAEELQDYQFWGHCDTDQYFGSISSFITDEILEQYDKILCLGHFTLFRNIDRINRMFTVQDRKYNQSYRDVFSYEGHWIFDEWPTDPRTSINRIFKQEKVYTYYNADSFCDLVPFKSCFQRTLFYPETETWAPDPVKNEIYLWSRGTLLRCWLEKEQLYKEPVLYVHIRQREIQCLNYQSNQPDFLILPNKFISCSQPDDHILVNMIRRTRFRGMLYPDEVQRKLHILLGYSKLVYYKILRILKLK